MHTSPTNFLANFEFIQLNWTIMTEKDEICMQAQENVNKISL